VGVDNWALNKPRHETTTGTSSRETVAEERVDIRVYTEGMSMCTERVVLCSHMAAAAGHILLERFASTVNQWVETRHAGASWSMSRQDWVILVDQQWQTPGGNYTRTHTVPWPTIDIDRTSRHSASRWSLPYETCYTGTDLCVDLFWRVFTGFWWKTILLLIADNCTDYHANFNTKLRQDPVKFQNTWPLQSVRLVSCESMALVCAPLLYLYWEYCDWRNAQKKILVTIKLSLNQQQNQTPTLSQNKVLQVAKENPKSPTLHLRICFHYINSRVISHLHLCQNKSMSPSNLFGKWPSFSLLVFISVSGCNFPQMSWFQRKVRTRTKLLLSDSNPQYS
jgi:hypothetical protein